MFCVWRDLRETEREEKVVTALGLRNLEFIGKILVIAL